MLWQYPSSLANLRPIQIIGFQARTPGSPAVSRAVSERHKVIRRINHVPSKRDAWNQMV